MGEQSVPEKTQLANADITDGDFFYIVDTSAGDDGGKCLDANGVVWTGVASRVDCGVAINFGTALNPNGQIVETAGGEFRVQGRENDFKIRHVGTVAGNIYIQNLSHGNNIICTAEDAGGVERALLTLSSANRTAIVSGIERTKAAASADSDAFNVAGVSVLEVDTAAGNVTLGGLAGGVANQDLRIVKINTANSLIIENEEGTGTQKFGTADGADITLTHRGGVDLHFNGTLWLEVSH